MTIDGDKLPIGILKFGSKLQEVCDRQSLGTVILAGGAPRDIDNGRDVKDYDFYVPITVFKTIIKAAAATILGVPTSYEDKDGEYAFEVMNVGDNVQVILVEDPVAEVDNFDINLCKIYIDFKKGELVRTQEYLDDVEGQYITCAMKYAPPTRKIFMDNPFYKEMAGHENHLKRVKDKYPTWVVRYVEKDDEIPF